MTRSIRPRPTKSLPTSTDRPVALAITGPIGAGKSAALDAFARHGAATISGDEIVHRLLRTDPEVRCELADRFGPEIIGHDGADRAKLAELVFSDANELDWLERLLHPRVVRENLRWRAEVEAQPDPPRLTVTEVPLLYETGAEKRFDAVVVITASEDVRRARRRLTDDREARLIPEPEKVSLADYAFVNDGTLEELDAFVADVVERLTA